MNCIIFISLLLVTGILSARWNWFRKSCEGLPVLMYHKIGIPPGNSKIKKLWVSTKKFTKQMSYLKQKGYNSITFIDLIESIKSGKALPDNPVIITFDDGYENNYIEAFPVLKKFGFKATIFLVAEYIGGDNLWHDPDTEPYEKMMTWEQILQMQDYGIEFGSHTLHHANLLLKNTDEITHEIQSSKKVLQEKLQKSVIAFAYPYGAGAYDNSIKEIVRNAGYMVACGIKQGKNQFPITDMFNLRRLLVRGEESLFDLCLNLTRGRNRL